MKNTAVVKKEKMRFEDLPKDYAGLCRLHLPRPIHDKIGYEETTCWLEVMVGFEEKFNPDQADYCDLLTELVSDYETENEAPEDGLPLAERLSYLLENCGWNASDFARFLKLHPTMGSKILNGERKLTVEHIEKLARHFKLDVTYFMTAAHGQKD